MTARDAALEMLAVIISADSSAQRGQSHGLADRPYD